MATCPTRASRDISENDGTAVATRAGAAENFQNEHGDGRTDVWPPSSAAAIAASIAQWCAPFLRQQAGRLASACAPASSGCNGKEAVNSSNRNAAQRLTAPAYHRDGDTFLRPGSVGYNGEMSPSSALPRPVPELWTEQALLQALHDIAGVVAITDNVRASRILRQQYNWWQRSVANVGWRTPEILAWEPWLEGLWNSAAIGGIETRVLLNDAQELEIWGEILARDDGASETVVISGLTALAQKTWRQLRKYRVPLHAFDGAYGVDSQAFLRWAVQFDKHCEKSGFLSPAQLEAAAIEWLPSDAIVLPAEIFLLGFDRVTPAQAALVDALRAKGCTVREIELRPAGACTTPAIVYARTRDEEIFAAAHWAREALMADPARRIGVIVPALEETRDEIDATFRRVLVPSSMDVRNVPPNPPYEFSLGTPMRRIPSVRTALSLMRWLDEPLSPEEISWLLVHGDFGHAANDANATSGALSYGEGMLERAKIDRRFREREGHLGDAVPFTAFQQWLSQRTNSRQSAPLRRVFDRLSATLRGRALQKQRSYAEWREIAEEILTTANWGLSHAAEGHHYQLLARWDKLLDNLSSLNLVTGPVSFSTAVKKLHELTAHTLFALETKNAPVQILGIAESAGLLFDSVWWMNARAGSWQPRGSVMPFLPWSVQHEARMPYADPAEDGAFARRVTERILGSGSSVAVSFAMEENDATNASAHLPDREVVVSPAVRELLPDVSMTAAAEFVPASGVPSRDRDFFDLEDVREETALPFRSDRVRGGVDFLELQAACPFRAFAELRLGARPLDDFSAGLSRRDQGIAIHRVLAAFWKEIQSQTELLKKTEEDIRLELRRHIAFALSKFLRNATEPWQNILLEIESDRMETRLLEWLLQEKRRLPFTVIATEATLKDAQIGGVTLDCRIDRIDAVDEGVVLLDYKTGTVNRKSCEGDRPDAPQLPAYAVLRIEAATQPLAAVAFASLHPRNIGFTVVDSLPSIFSIGKKPSEASVSASPAEAVPPEQDMWNPEALSPEQMKLQQEIWDATLTRLAEGFRAGTAVVDPKKPAETCRHCAQGLLCRIRETKSVPLPEVDLEEEFS